MILTSEPLATVKEAFSLFSRDESHKTMQSGGFGVKSSTSAFKSIPNDNKGTNNSFVPRSYSVECRVLVCEWGKFMF